MHVSRLATVGEIAAGVAHELNQPLTAITTYAQACVRMIERGEPKLEEVRNALGQIATEAMRAGGIIRQLRSLVSTPAIERRPTDINALIGELRALMEADARLHGARLQYDIVAGLPPVSVDGLQIQHVILNLLRNALEALAVADPGDREVVIRTALLDGGGVEFSLTDSGPGVAAEAAERIFDPFFTTKASGTGLGLAISATILRLNGGTLGYRAVRPAGACFFARLPAA